MAAIRGFAACILLSAAPGWAPLFCLGARLKPKVHKASTNTTMVANERLGAQGPETADTHVGAQTPQIAEALGSRDKLLSVMNVNTYLLEVRFFGYAAMGGGFRVAPKPDMDKRAAGLATWFNTLADKDVPDVVVFNEMLSKDSSRVIKQICASSYQRVGLKGESIIPCDQGKKFGSVTKALGGVGSIGIGGGVIILAKVGLEMSEYREGVYAKGVGMDKLSQKGYISVKVSKPSSRGNGVPLESYVVGTHTQAWPKNRNVRKKQFLQLQHHIEAEIPPGLPVVVAGDLNVEEDEVDDMKEILRASNSPLETKGFWLPLKEEIPFSAFAGGGFNAYLHFDPEEVDRKQPYDQIVFSTSDSNGMNDRQVPHSMKWQYVPMKSEQCFETSMSGVSGQHKISIDDLSDHYAAYGELCFDETGEDCKDSVITDHYGFTGIARDGPEKKCCPGRGLFRGKCFDWYPGGIKGDRITVQFMKTLVPGQEQGDCMLRRKGKVRRIEGLHQVRSIDECYDQLAEKDLPFQQIPCENR